jgi:hypothetical protein
MLPMAWLEGVVSGTRDAVEEKWDVGVLSGFLDGGYHRRIFSCLRLPSTLSSRLSVGASGACFHPFLFSPLDLPAALNA